MIGIAIAALAAALFTICLVMIYGRLRPEINVTQGGAPSIRVFRGLGANWFRIDGDFEDPEMYSRLLAQAGEALAALPMIEEPKMTLGMPPSMEALRDAYNDD